MSAREPLSHRGCLWHLQPRTVPAHLRPHRKNSLQPCKQLASTPRQTKGASALNNKNPETPLGSGWPKAQAHFTRLVWGHPCPAPSFVSPLPPATLNSVQILKYAIALLPQNLGELLSEAGPDPRLIHIFLSEQCFLPNAPPPPQTMAGPSIISSYKSTFPSEHEQSSYLHAVFVE